MNGRKGTKRLLGNAAGVMVAGYGLHDRNRQPPETHHIPPNLTMRMLEDYSFRRRYFAALLLGYGDSILIALREIGREDNPA